MLKHLMWAGALFVMTMFAVSGWGGWISSLEEIRQKDQIIHEQQAVLVKQGVVINKVQSKIVEMTEAVKLATERLERANREREGR